MVLRPAHCSVHTHLTSDGHWAANLVYGYDRAAEAARAASYTRSVILIRGGQVECDL